MIVLLSNIILFGADRLRPKCQTVRFVDSEEFYKIKHALEQNKIPQITNYKPQRQYNTFSTISKRKINKKEKSKQRRIIKKQQKQMYEKLKIAIIPSILSIIAKNKQNEFIEQQIIAKQYIALLAAISDLVIKNYFYTEYSSDEDWEIIE